MRCSIFFFCWGGGGGILRPGFEIERIPNFTYEAVLLSMPSFPWVVLMLFFSRLLAFKLWLYVVGLMRDWGSLFLLVLCGLGLVCCHCIML